MEVQAVLEVINEIEPEAGKYMAEASAYVHKWYLHGVELWTLLPGVVRHTVILAFFLAAIGTVTSLVKAVANNYREWKPMPNSKLMYSYFCGSGDHQRRLIRKSAGVLVMDRTWPWISAAGLAYRLGNLSHGSKLVMFLLSFAYVPLAVIGGVELLFRSIISYITYLILNIVVAVAYLVIRLIIYIVIPIVRIIDGAMRVEQHCPYCYNTFKLPYFRCPHCGEIHEQLIPARSGLFFARCSCGHFLPCAVVSKRDKLDSVCPKCRRDLAASNAKEFSIQVIGGDSAGKTAFIAAFQHMYAANLDSCTVRGNPQGAFSDLETMFSRGQTEPSSPSEVIPYTLVHQSGASAGQSLVFYDIPDEMLLSDEYERNPLNFGYSNGVVVIIDPLSVPSVRDECERIDANSTDNSSQNSSDSIVIHFITKFSEISGRAARKMSDIPVAVLIAKSDIKGIQSKIGVSRIKSAFDADPERYRNSIEIAADEVCRGYLADIGLANILNNLDAVFSMVRCFPASAIGHGGGQERPFEPYGVVEPIAWIGESGRAGMAAQLREARDRVSADGFQEQMADHNLAVRYAEAEKLYRTGKLEAATRAFANLRSYKDAAARADEIREQRYKIALKKKDSRDFDGAIDGFSGLGNYKDALRQVVAAQFAKADYLLSAQRYQEAIDFLATLPKSDARSEKIRSAKYDYALFQIQRQDYIGANDLLMQLDGYCDSREKAASIALNLMRQRIKAGAKRKIRFGKYEWRVLTIKNDVALIITENNVKNVPYSENLEGIHWIDGICWSESTVRKYLNTGFLGEFSDDEKSLIQTSPITTPDNPEYGTPGEPGTSGRVFLLSIEEALQFFSDDADRRPDESVPGVEADWSWLRSLGGEKTFAAIIEKNGKISMGGSRITNLKGGIRPTMFIKL